MKQIPTWEQPKTSRVYLHPVYSERLISLYPDLKVTDLDLIDKPMHFNQPGFGVHLLFGSEPTECDMEKTEWKKPEGGLPIYTLYNRDENGCEIAMTAFCGSGRIPCTYVSVRVTNPNDVPVKSVVGLLPRYNAKDHYLTGLHDTGYEPYNPNICQWYLSWQDRFAPLTDDPSAAASEDGYGWMKVLETSGGSLRWISRDEQKNRFRAHDYYRVEWDLAAGASAEVRFVLCRKQPGSVPSYTDALTAAEAYWNTIQHKIRLLPAAEDKEDMFRQNVTVALQMLQHYENGGEWVYSRQGDVGRYLWVWEAVHYLTAFDRIGLSEYVTDVYRMWYGKWQLREGPEKGKLANPYVNWDNTNGSALAGTAFHLLTVDDPALFEEFHESMNLALAYIQYRRDPARAAENEVKGLFTSGKASDWGEVGQHWTYTDAVNVYGLKFLARCYEHFGAPEAEEVRAVYEDYRSVVLSVERKFAEEHRGDHSYVMPHILGVPFEASYNHCFYTDGEPYLLNLDVMDPNSEEFEQMENFYREAGILDDEHGVAARMTNDDCGSPGLYGHVYYTGVAEICWIPAWKARGELEKAETYTRGLLNYNLTAEYIPSERYCSTDPWFTPWQPNGSGAGRICHFLLDHYGERRV